MKSSNKNLVVTTAFSGTTSRAPRNSSIQRTGSSGGFGDGHVRAFAFFGGVPKSILYDNTKIVAARILGDGKRQRTRVFTELQSHYLFEDRFGRLGKGNDKGKVEGLVGYARRNFLVPIPAFGSFEPLNSYLLECCRLQM